MWGTAYLCIPAYLNVQSRLWITVFTKCKNGEKKLNLILECKVLNCDRYQRRRLRTSKFSKRDKCPVLNTKLAEVI